MKTVRLSLIASALMMSLAMPAQANTTTSSIKGHITGPQNNPAVGSIVTILHVPSGTSKTAVVNDSGLFSASGLRVGGPYTIIIKSSSYGDQTIDGVYLSLGETFEVDRQMQSQQQQQVERIAVLGRHADQNFGDDSPAARFSLKDLESAPSVNRDIKDLLRVDPRIYVNESGSGAVQCVGGNPRFNSFTVDGTRMNDNFGLNSNGYPTVRLPFSYDAIDQVAVELAPFDVQYGGFTACNINAVTKSGGNELKGSVFFDYTSDDFRGDKLEGKSFPIGNFTERRYGTNFGLPIIEDKLFFFMAYEKLEGAEIFNYSPVADGKIDQATLDEIAQITRDIYQYEPGTLVPSLPVDDEKVLIKLDWNINDNHRASLVYNYNDGFELSQSDGGSSNISLSNHFYQRGAKFTSGIASLYSDWTDDFSTEFRIGASTLDNRQISTDQASGFGEFQVRTNNINVYIGPDDSRQSNKLKYDTTTFKAMGTYRLDEHTLTFGYEREALDVFNLFVQHTEGEFRFSSIDDYRNGIARVYYGNASTQNPSDAAGEFEYEFHTTYFQDEIEFIDQDITLTVGLRYDWYTSDDVPKYNAKFEERYGFSNQQNLDDVSLLQPRIGMNWAVNDQLQVRAGAGLYSGGNPNVWISNSYSNDGISNLQFNQRNMQLLGPDAEALTGSGRPGYDVPLSLFNKVGSGTADSGTDATDPNFDLPSEWKYALGLTYTTEEDYVLTLDLLVTDKQDSAIVKNLALVKTGTAPDGRPVYSDDLHPGQSDLLLTNVKGKDAMSEVWSTSISKAYDNGFSFALSYAYTIAKDINPMTSSVAFSNFNNVAVSDPQNPDRAHSNYEIPHRYTLNLSYRHEYFPGYETRYSLFGQANQGHPYGYSFTRGTSGLGFNDADRQLLYVPLVDDPNVIYGDGFDVAKFDQFIKAEGLEKFRGRIMPRNSLQSDWWVKFDFRMEQEFKGFSEDHKGSVYFVIDNIGNMLNDKWGVLKEGNFLLGAVNAEVTDDNKYLYKEFTDPSTQSRSDTASQWEVRFGVKYRF